MSSEHASSIDPDKPRRPWIVIVLRLALVVLFATPVVWFVEAITGAVKTDSVSGPLTIVFLMLTVVVGVPSLVIATGLLKRRRWAAWLSIVFDVLFGSAILSFVVSGLSKAFVTPAYGRLGMLLTFYYSTVLFPSDHYDPKSLSHLLMLPAFAVFALILLAEGAYLLHWMNVPRRKWSAWGCAVVAIIALSVVPKWLQSRQFSSLLTYARTQWIEIPEESRTYYRDQAGYSRFLEIHTPSGVFVTIWLNRQDWRRDDPAYSRHGLNAKNEPVLVQPLPRVKHQGRWYFFGRQNPSDGWECLRASVSARGTETPESSDDALELIRAVGVTDPDLRPAPGTTMYRDRKTFCFWSPRARGIYAVPVKERDVYLFLRDAVSIP